MYLLLMLWYAARAVPWTRVALAAGLVVVLMELVRWDPWVLWPLQGTAVGLVAGATAWCFDEAAAAVVDPASRGLAWRTAARGVGPLLLLAAWTATVVHAGERALFGHAATIWWQGMAACAVGAAYAGWRRAQGEPTPGVPFATTTVAATTAWSLVRPLEAHLPVFPYATTSPAGWQLSLVGWTAAVGVVAVAVLAAALGDAPWWMRQAGD